MSAKTKVEVPLLDGPGRERWETFLKERLTKQGKQRKQIGLAGYSGPSGSEVTNIFKGELKVLVRLFKLPERVSKLEKDLGLDAGQLLAELRRCATPELAERAWHPAFPEVPESAVLVAPHCRWEAQSASGHANLGEFVRFASGRDELACVWVVGRAGLGARTLAEQIAAALKLELHVVMPEGGWARWRGELKGRSIAWVEDHDASDALDAVVYAQPWGAYELREVVGKLRQSGRIDAQRLDALDEVVSQIEAKPELLGPDRWPRAVIATLAAYARDGVPTSVAEVRSRALTQAWELALKRPGAERIGLLAPNFMDELWLLRWRSSASDWPRMTREEVLALVREVMPSAEPRRAKELLDGLRQEKGAKAREAKLDEIAKLIAGPPEGVVDALVAGGLLVRERVVSEVSAVELFVAADETFARAWVARGLASKLGSPPRELSLRTSDYDFGELAAELAYTDAKPGDVLALLDTVEPEFSIDLAVGLMEWLAAVREPTIAPKDHDKVVAIWATALWGAARNPFRLDPWAAFGRGGALDVAAASVSWEFRKVLPLLDGPRYLESLERHVPPDIVARFGSLEVGESLNDGDHDGEREVGELVRRAPYQTLAFRWDHQTGMHRLLDEPERTATWIEELAGRGHGPAIALLRARGLEPQDFHLWGELPAAVRFRWLDVEATPPPWEPWRLLVWPSADKHPDGALDALRRFPRESVERRFLVSLGEAERREGERFECDQVNKEQVLEAAVALGLMPVLEVLARRPHVFRRRSGKESSVWDAVDAIWRQAVVAAKALHRLGRPEALHELWRRPVAEDVAIRLRVARVCTYSAPDAIAAGFPVEVGRDFVDAQVSRFGEGTPRRLRHGRGAESPAEAEVAGALEWLSSGDPLGAEVPEAIKTWLLDRAQSVVLERNEQDIAKSHRQAAGLALVECDDEVLWDGERFWDDWEVLQAMLASAAWRERTFRRLGPSGTFLLKAVPRGGEPAWFWEALRGLPLGNCQLHLVGRADHDGPGRALVEERWRRALQEGRLGEAGGWSSVATNQGYWPEGLISETLQRWMAMSEPFDGPPEFFSEVDPDPFAIGWRPFLHLAIAWVDRLQTAPEPWLRAGVEALWRKRPEVRTCELTSAYWKADPKRVRQVELPTRGLFSLAKTVDARSLCDEFLTSEDRRDEVIAWRLRGLDRVALEGLLQEERWAPFAARRLVELGEAAGRTWLEDRIPATAEQCEGDIWEMVLACLPKVAIATIDRLVAAEAQRARSLDFVRRQRELHVHPDVWAHATRCLRRLFAS